MIFGFVTFVSASMGILAKDNVQFVSVISKQVFFGIIFGLIACFLFSNIDYKFFKRHALFILIFSVILT